MSAKTRLCALLCALLSSQCIDRPIGHLEPRTTSVVTSRFDQATPPKLDLLLVVDNSASMADKQRVLARALPDLVKTLVTPPCVRQDGSRQVRLSVDEPCESGARPEFEPLSDMRVGVITSSLGGFGAPKQCKTNQEADMAHLLPTRPRAQDIPSDGGILKWKRGEDPGPFIDSFGELVLRAGQEGCGWESGLEAWYRFLIDPAPYVELKRTPCKESDTRANCARAVTGTDGQRLVDEALLAQRKAFLRDDSLLVVAMLTDENDCSFREDDLSWLLSQTTNSNDGKRQRFAHRPSKLCASDPENECCHSCATSPPAGCPSEMNSSGTRVGEGCAAESVYGPTPAPTADPNNLRCFDQKRRFGIDLLYPEQRYVNALSQPKLCTSSPSLNQEDCAEQDLVDNPLFPGLVDGVGRSSASDVFLVGLLGVPWQDLAVDPDPSVPLRYRPAESSEDGAGINWDWIVGSEGAPPGDPLMLESVFPRTGVTPSLGVPLAPPASPALANPINGHEWNNPDQDDLQYACIFPLTPSKSCAMATAGCDCKADEDGPKQSPLCQAADGTYGTEQFYAKAYPGTRQLNVLKGLGASSVVASICPKQLEEPQAADFGYRPAMRAIVDRLKGRLKGLCYERSLSVQEDNTAHCRIVEVRRDDGPCPCEGPRTEVGATLRQAANKQLVNQGWCTSEDACAALCACEIEQVPATAETFSSCQTDAEPSDHGWCYIDEAQGIGSAELLEGCPATARRNVRFVGDGIPVEGSTTVISCAGDILDD